MPSIMDKTRGVPRKKTYNRPPAYVIQKDPRSELLSSMTVTQINPDVPSPPSQFANKPDYERRWSYCRRRNSPPPVRHTAKSLQQKRYINAKINAEFVDRSVYRFTMPPPRQPLSALDPLVASPSGPAPSLASSTRACSAKSSVTLPSLPSSRPSSAKSTASVGPVRSMEIAPTTTASKPPARPNQPPKMSNAMPSSFLPKRSYQTPTRSTLHVPDHPPIATKQSNGPVLKPLIQSESKQCWSKQTSKIPRRTTSTKQNKSSPARSEPKAARSKQAIQTKPKKTTSDAKSEQATKLRRAKMETPPAPESYLRPQVERDDARIFRKFMEKEKEKEKEKKCENKFAKRPTESKRLPVLHPKPWR